MRRDNASASKRATINMIIALPPFKLHETAKALYISMRTHIRITKSNSDNRIVNGVIDLASSSTVCLVSGQPGRNLLLP